MSDAAAPVPPGGSGADSGAVDGARIEPDEGAHIANISSQNDIPGVGTRGPDGGMETDREGDDEPDRDSLQEEEVWHDSSEAPIPVSTLREDAIDSELTIESYEPGVDPESARTSRIVNDDS